ncbi:MAG: aldo/keto reductase [Methanomassiliicoccus sp.]|nr:aldo/keto reductase [Methanomassiliicoccus sp.]
MVAQSLSTTVTLNNGVRMPILGLGVFKVPDEETYRVVTEALEIGYRHIDTAAYYQNERGVGRAVGDSGLRREDIFVTTKVWYNEHGRKETLAAFDRSLEALGLDYVDLYLVHWPREGRMEAWKAMERILDEGRARAIGVSNYLVRHLDDTIARSPVVPAVDQVEFSPFLYQKELLSYCRSRGIVLEAYSPLARGRRFDDPRLVKLASKYGRTPAQMMLRWVLQKGMVAIPKSAHPERMRENASVFDFEISAEDEATMDRFDEGYHTTWDPESIP